MPKFILSVFLLAGVIDADYRGNVGVVLFNFSDSDFTSKIQFAFETIRILFLFQLRKVIVFAQLICEKIEMADLVEEAVRSFLCFSFVNVLIYVL